MHTPELADLQKLHQLCSGPGFRREDLPRVMVDRDGERERESRESMPSARLDDDDSHNVMESGQSLVVW